ncbi:Protein Prenyltransferase Alpha Subunit Repeat-Containing Protein 1 [Manis pentadactyla]|nr:Protein Prenyltransferase Alpha Subunit Repeat-Containing Protein 1 [Manis pentadactyla]
MATWPSALMQQEPLCPEPALQPCTGQPASVPSPAKGWNMESANHFPGGTRLLEIGGVHLIEPVGQQRI